MSAALEHVLAVLMAAGKKPVRSGDRITAQCPAHDDANPSFSAWLKASGWVGVKCFAGCSESVLLSALRLEARDLGPERKGTARHVALETVKGPALVHSSSPQTLAAFCEARRLDPAALASRWKVEERPHAGRPALFYPTRVGISRVKYLDGAPPKYRWAEKGGKAHWYGLPEARRNGGPVLYLVNGEPSVWACELRGVPAVCPCGEGVTLSPAMLEDLKGSGFERFAVCYDLDAAGRHGARAAVEALQAAGLSVVALELPADLGPGGDVDDLHRRVGADLRAALEALPELKEPVPQAAGERKEKIAGKQGQKVLLEDVEPWDQEVDGADLLHEIVTTFLRFVAMPEEDAVAAALWVLHAHAQEAFFVSPILAITSPEKRCGKTTLLSIIKGMSPRALPFSNCTPAVLFRAVEKFRPTVLIDEADTFLRGKQADPELRGLINSGHTRTAAFVLRTVGDSHEPVKFTTWAPKVISLIGNLPETLEDRSVVLRMRRRAAHERIERLRADRLSELSPIARKAARWAADHFDTLKEMDPLVPDEIVSDRAQDNWRPLLAIADAVDGPWLKRARRAAVSLSSTESAVESYGVLLLQDIREVFEREQTDRLSSFEIIRALTDLEERPWTEYHDGKPLTPPRLAKMLRPFEITPYTIRTEGKTAKGYHREKFKDAWGRYLGGVLQSVTPSQPKPDKDSGVFQSVTQERVLRHEKAPKPPPIKTCDAVTAQGRGGPDESAFWEV